MDLLILVFFLLPAASILLALCIIDLRSYQLPDKLNLSFCLLGIGFHFFSSYGFLPIESQILGALLSGLLFLGLRWLFWKLRNTEALGLGDVKFITAASAWVGLDGIFLVISIGAISTICAVAILHYLRTNDAQRHLLSMRVPFGPGLTFSTALVFTGILIERM